MTKKALSVIRGVAEKLLDLMEIKADIEVTEDKENQAVLIQIETETPGILIGYHGETLSSFQLILGIMANRQLKEWTRILVNVGDYRQKREEVLKRIALSAAQRAHFSGAPVTLADLSSAERRIIHLVLADHEEVESYSEGEGRDRRLIIKPRQK